MLFLDLCSQPFSAAAAPESPHSYTRTPSGDKQALELLSFIPIVPACPWSARSYGNQPTSAHLILCFQVVLINAIKDVAKALSDLIGATKGAASKPADDPSMYQLKGAAKVLCKLEGWENLYESNGRIHIRVLFSLKKSCLCLQCS